MPNGGGRRSGSPRRGPGPSPGKCPASPPLPARSREIQQSSESQRTYWTRRTSMKLLAGLSVLSILLLGVTLPAQETAAPQGHPYYPLKLQSEWTYKVQG